MYFGQAGDTGGEDYHVKPTAVTLVGIGFHPAGQERAAGRKR